MDNVFWKKSQGIERRNGPQYAYMVVLCTFKYHKSKSELKSSNPVIISYFQTTLMLVKSWVLPDLDGDLSDVDRWDSKRFQKCYCTVFRIVFRRKRLVFTVQGRTLCTWLAVPSSDWSWPLAAGVACPRPGTFLDPSHRVETRRWRLTSPAASWRLSQVAKHGTSRSPPLDFILRLNHADIKVRCHGRATGGL